VTYIKEKRAVDGEKGSVIDLSEADFEGTVRKNDLAVVMFCRSGCPHCFRMEPIYRELSEEMVDRVLFCRVDVLSNVALTHEYGIKGTPTFVLMKHGTVVGALEGECSKELLKSELVRRF
jgi:thioredoxin-like negative regulator of GroEL